MLLELDFFAHRHATESCGQHGELYVFLLRSHKPWGSYSPEIGGPMNIGVVLKTVVCVTPSSFGDGFSGNPPTAK